MSEERLYLPKSADLWESLREELDGESRSVLINLGRKFRTMCCGEDGDICVHFGKVAHLHEELPVLGCTASDDECATPLMGSLL